jgi:hypothetical protein
VLLAISALDVAFASAIGAAVVAVASPLIGWWVTKSGWEYDRQRNLSQRTYDARSKIYVEMLTWVGTLRSYAEDHRDQRESASWREEYQDPQGLMAQIAAFGSNDAVKLVATFYGSFSVAWDEIDAAINEETRKAVDLTPLALNQLALEELVRVELAA